MATDAGDVARRGHQAAQPAVAHVEVLDAAREAHLAAQRFDAAADRLDHGRQPIAAQVRPGVVEDRRLALALGEQFQDAAHIGAAAATGQFAVAEGAGAALAEKVIALRIERAALVEGADIADALAHRSAALQDQRPIALLRQEIRRHQAAGTGADHDRTLLQRGAARRRHEERLFGVEIDADRRTHGRLGGA